MFKKKMKQIGAMAMAASMILASVQLPPLAANAAENTNLALSATATASNSEGGNEIAKINDGNMLPGMQFLYGNCRYTKVIFQIPEHRLQRLRIL